MYKLLNLSPKSRLMMSPGIVPVSKRIVAITRLGVWGFLITLEILIKKKDFFSFIVCWGGFDPATYGVSRKAINFPLLIKFLATDSDVIAESGRLFSVRLTCSFMQVQTFFGVKTEKISRKRRNRADSRTLQRDVGLNIAPSSGGVLAFID